MLKPAVELLREHGVQVTAQRLAIMRVVAEHPHATADEVGDIVRSQLGAISRQAVYDSLGVLADKNLIRRIQPAESAGRYESRVGDNHHHLICRVCRMMFDVDCAVGEVPCLTADDTTDSKSTKPKSSIGAGARPVERTIRRLMSAADAVESFETSQPPSATFQGARHE